MIPMSTSTHHRAVLLKNHERNTSARVVVRRAEEQKPKLKKAEEFTTGGGGARGYCDVDEIKNAIKECAGLEGAKLEACYAQYGCDIDIVTDHYAKVAGVEKKTKEGSLRILRERVKSSGGEYVYNTENCHPCDSFKFNTPFYCEKDVKKDVGEVIALASSNAMALMSFLVAIGPLLLMKTRSSRSSHDEETAHGKAPAEPVVIS